MVWATTTSTPSSSQAAATAAGTSVQRAPRGAGPGGLTGVWAAATDRIASSTLCSCCGVRTWLGGPGSPASSGSGVLDDAIGASFGVHPNASQAARSAPPAPNDLAA